MRSIVVPVVLGVLVASCAADPSLTDEVAVEASDAATSGTDVVEADDSAENSALEAAADEDGTDAAAPDEVPSDGPEREAPAVRPGTVVTWLDTEFLLPSPWRLSTTDGAAIFLDHPSTAGPRGRIYVRMDGSDGQASAARRASIPTSTASGGIEPTFELQTLFASGGPGLRIGDLPGPVVMVSDTGISVSISREGGELTLTDVDTVLALLATIEPPTVTPASEPSGRAAPQPPEGAATIRFGPDGLVPYVRFGTGGWDSSGYPDLPPFPVPEGFVLATADDVAGQLAFNARSWRYVGPPGVDLLALCERAREQIVASGGRIAPGDHCVNEGGGPFEGVTQQFAVLGFRADGASVAVRVLDGSSICPELPLDRNCSSWRFGMNLTPPG